MPNQPATNDSRLPSDQCLVGNLLYTYNVDERRAESQRLKGEIESGETAVWDVRGRGRGVHSNNGEEKWASHK